MRTAILIRPTILKLANRGTRITLAEWDQIKSKINGFEREYLVPFMSAELLIQLTETTMAQCEPKLAGEDRPAATCDEMLAHVYTPAVLQMLKDVRAGFLR